MEEENWRGMEEVMASMDEEDRSMEWKRQRGRKNGYVVR